MKWIQKISAYTSYVSQCTNAIAKAVETLSNHWPTNNPFARSVSNVPKKEEGLAMGDKAK